MSNAVPKTLAQEIAALTPIARRTTLDADRHCANLEDLLCQLEHLTESPEMLRVVDELRSGMADLNDSLCMVTERLDRILHLISATSVVPIAGAPLGHVPATIEPPADPYADGMEALGRMEGEPTAPRPNGLWRLMGLMFGK